MCDLTWDIQRKSVLLFFWVLYDRDDVWFHCWRDLETKGVIGVNQKIEVILQFGKWILCSYLVASLHEDGLVVSCFFAVAAQPCPVSGGQNAFQPLWCLWPMGFKTVQFPACRFWPECRSRCVSGRQTPPTCQSDCVVSDRFIAEQPSLWCVFSDHQ